MLKIAPSVIAADFGHLAEQLAEAERSGADVIHFDSMDGHFVPNLSIGPLVLEAVRRATALRIDAHLMIDQPERFIPQFAGAGADTIVVHVEATVHLHRALEQIRSLGKRAGVALNPSTPAVQVSEVLDNVDQVLAMTVNPGFGGQTFIAQTLPKIKALRSVIGDRQVELCVDGGIDESTAKDAVACGADVLVAGTAVFRHPRGIGYAIDALRSAGTAK
jgi:ribulose-phosphate 3-epimerase